MDRPYAQQHYLIDDLILWRHKIRAVQFAVLPPFTTRSNPLVVGDFVIASVFSPGIIYTVDRSTGTKRWRLRTDGLAGSAVIFTDETLYAHTNHTLYALDAASGRVKWTFCPYGTQHEWIYSTPTVHESRVFLGDRAGKFHCLNAKSGLSTWTKQTSRSRNPDVNATALVHKNSVIVATNAGLAIAYEIVSGKPIWKTRLDGPSIRELCMFESHVVVVTEQSIYLLDPSDGKLHQRWNWRGRSIRVVVRANKTLIAVTEIKNADGSNHKNSRYSNTRDIRGLRGNGILFERPVSEYIYGLRWDKGTGLVYESRIGGFGILSAETGERLYNISHKTDSLNPGIADVRENTIYLLADRTMIALMKYGGGLPWYRQSALQAMCGVPLSQATMWERCEATADAALGIFLLLNRMAADGEVMHTEEMA